MAAIAHLSLILRDCLRLGTEGIIAEIKEAMQKYPENNQDFYKGAIIALEALAEFGQRYSVLCAQMAEEETDPQRNKNCWKWRRFAGKCPNIPLGLSIEALQSMTFLQIALCIES